MPSDFQPPKRFRLVRELGRGAVGTVYEALDLERDARVAIKVLQRVNAESIGRFKREFRGLQDLHHPNLVSLGELFSDGEAWFFTMDLIEGEDFLAWVIVAGAADEEDTMRTSKRPPRRSFDEGRLRESLSQLAQGLGALHAAGKVHRDIKPSNVLVERSGRVVILDFGLASDLAVHADSFTTSDDLEVVGTPVYMAPEQAASKPVGPAADWYAVGVLLYEALVGDPPFFGRPLDILMRKQREDPKPPSATGATVPRDLEALCMQLLRIEPGARPTGEGVLRALGRALPSRPSFPSLPPPSTTAQHTFIGRDAELAALREAYDDIRTRNSAGLAVLVCGESGIGKSALVKHFTDTLTASDRDIVVLRGRCHERETVPYKALDGVIDALSRHLGRLSDDQVIALLPMRSGPLVRVFPVLGRVRAIAKLPATSGGNDPLEIRSRAFQATRDILARLAERRRVIVCVDDMQWADADSVALLAEVMRPPEAPRLLFVATLREDPNDDPGEVGSRPRAAMLASSIGGEVRTIDLARLAEHHARELAAELVRRAAPGLPMSVDTIAREAEGHPLFIDEIVRHLLLSGAHQAGSLRLDDALWSRVTSFAPEERRLVELVSVAGAPLAQDVAARVLGVEAHDFSRLASFLRVAHLVRTSGVRASDTIEPYHTRVRATVLQHLDREAQRAHHQDIALALEASANPDVEALAIHWQGAGDSEKTVKYLLAAADRATQTLAFDRAAQLLQYALAHGAQSATREDREAERALQTRLGNAFAMAGAGARAAAVYRAAAVGAKASEAIDLQRRAAEQLLRSGHFDEGLAVIRTVLPSIGLAFPERPWLVLVSLLWWRLVLRVRGLEFRERDQSSIAQRDLARCDILWSVALTLPLADVLRAQLFHARSLLFALGLGDSVRVARCVATEIGHSGAQGRRGWKRAQELRVRATALAAKSENETLIAWTIGTSGAAAYLNGRFREGLALCDEAALRLREHTVGTAFEISSAQFFSLQALVQLGELRELARRVPAALREATDRGDLYAAVNLRIGYLNLVWLVADDIATSRRQIAEAMSQWSKSGFHLEHYFELQALTNADLYAGDAARAYDRTVAGLHTMRRTLVTRVQMVRIYGWQLRARAGLALAEQEPGRRGELLAVVLADARRIEHERMAWSAPLARLLRAGAARVRGDLDETASFLERAMTGFDEVEMKLHAAVARLALGELKHGDEGKKLRDSAGEWMAAEGVRDAHALAAMIAPGLGR